MFKSKIAEPYYVRYEYVSEQQTRPIHLTRHSGQEFDFILSGSMKVQVGENIEVLKEGDSIYYDSSKPHGMIAVDGRDCLFLAVVLPGEDTQTDTVGTIAAAKRTENMIYDRFVTASEDENGLVTNIEFHDADRFNFAFDIVDGLARERPDKLAMIHLDRDRNETCFTFKQISKESVSTWHGRNRTLTPAAFASSSAVPNSGCVTMFGLTPVVPSI